MIKCGEYFIYSTSNFRVGCNFRSFLSSKNLNRMMRSSCETKKRSRQEIRTVHLLPPFLALLFQESSRFRPKDFGVKKKTRVENRVHCLPISKSHSTFCTGETRISETKSWPRPVSRFPNVLPRQWPKAQKLGIVNDNTGNWICGSR